MHLVRRSLLAALLLATPLALRAADPAPEAPAASTATPVEEEPPKTFAEALHRKGVKTTEGPAKVALGSVAEYQLLPGQHFVGADSLDLFYKLTHNMRAGDEVGVVIDPAGWMLFFDFSDVGYVKDDEKDQLNADKLLASMRENQDAANEARKKEGWDEMKLQGWAATPRYDEKTHNLTWALKLSSSRDNHQSHWINENIRLLGRGGYMNVTLVADPEEYQAASQATATLLAGNFGYTSGHRYAEWKKGDKIAAVGLSALVLGGGAAAAAKMGLLSKFGALLAKLGKGIIVVIAAIGAGIAKLFKKLTGSHPTDSDKTS
ncbi:MAG TPA: DUF2167 domain-containing protein [Opitutaceae bacterium]|nr:DUF2167 domain-containing protein [Opitutaceae bacterium]